MNKHIQEIQVLRAVGIIVVMVHHMDYNLFPWESVTRATFYTFFGGEAALEMFFTLSGFVIARLLFESLGRADNLYESLQVSCVFWLRRAWRLLPAAWLWLIITVLLTIFLNDSGVFGSVRSAWGGAVAAFLQVANLRFGDCIFNYECGATFPYWSLSLEEQFYIALPLLLIFSGKWFLRILLVLLVTQMFIGPLILPTYIRLHGFVLGVLLAIWSQSPSYKIFEPVYLGGHKIRRWFVLCTLLGLYCSMNSSLVPQFMVHQLSTVVGGMLVFIASFNSNYLWADGWFKSFGLWLGDRAYAMYLCHIPLFLLTKELALRLIGSEQVLGPEHFWYMLIGSLSMVVVASELTFRLVEVPLRAKGMAISKELQRKQAEDKLASTA
jgi:peptidoglycan/LPS O-acetylase OafA/YrhL